MFQKAFDVTHLYSRSVLGFLDCFEPATVTPVLTVGGILCRHRSGREMGWREHYKSW